MKSFQKGSIIIAGIIVMSIAIIGIGSYLLITELSAKNQAKQQEAISQTHNNTNICISDCSPAGAKNCINTNSYSICNQDIINNCLKWSTPFSCPDNWQCQDGNCVNSLISTSSTDLNTSQPSSQQQTTPQCTTGVCCDSSKQKFKSSSTICQSNFNPQYGCPWGNELGGDVGIRYQDKYCSGTSANCNGLTKWRGWEVSEQCNTNEYCSDGKCVVSQVASLKCSDGTSYNQCSSQKPKYCQNGDLIDECSTCGCSTNKNCINNQCIEECTNECYSGQR